MEQRESGAGRGDLALPGAAVGRAIDHMNDDHRENMVQMVRHLGGQAWATDAEMAAIDAAGVELRALSDGRAETVRLDFDAPLADAGQLRAAIVALAMRARD